MFRKSDSSNMDRHNKDQENHTSKPSSSTTNIQNHDMLALKRFITAKDNSNPYTDGRLQINTLLIDLTYSNLKQRHIEQRFDRHDTIAHVKQQIYLKTGTPPPFQRLQLRCGGQLVQEIPADADDPPISNMDHYKLGYFFGTHDSGNLANDDYNNDNCNNQHQVWPLLSQLQIHCTDINPRSVSRGGQLEDTTLVPKYRMSEEDYEKRPGTLRDWSRKQQAHDATFTLRKHAQYHREWCEAQRQHRLGLPLPRGFVLDSTGKVVRDDDPIVENDDDYYGNCNHRQSTTPE
jgi:Ubiquitin-like domain